MTRGNESDSIARLETSVDADWLISCAVLVLFMQCGFAMLEAGSVRAKNTSNILFKNMLDACIGAVAWWAVGHGLAYDSGSGFVGNPRDSAFLNTYIDRENEGELEFAHWFFQFVFAATAATIVSGAVAERATITAYLVYTTALTAVIYPVVVHWLWSSTGWLSPFSHDAMFRVMDFAGSGTVHTTGGVAALVGAAVIGPRHKRFDPDFEPRGHSSVLQVMGVLILWPAWYGFNAGSTLGLAAAGYARDAARVTVTTTLAASAGGLANSAIGRACDKHWDPVATCNGILAGLVSITGGCSVVYPWHAVVVGAVGSAIYTTASKLVLWARVDDPLDAFAVHGACGAWGVLVPGLFATPHYAYGGAGCGAFFGCFDALAAAAVGLCAQVAWVASTSLLMFGALHKLDLLRISLAQEEAGLDLSKHGGSAYIVAALDVK